MKAALVLSIFSESFRFAWQSLRSNLLRTFLSLLGITIGVFCISLILTFVDSLNANIKSSLSKLGENVIFVEKWPWLFSADYPWWKFVNRPEVSYNEMKQLQKRYKGNGVVGYKETAGRSDIRSTFNTAEKVRTMAVSFEYAQIQGFEFGEGRFFTEEESRRGAEVIVLGAEIADNLFPGRSPIGEKVTAYSRKLSVIGVLNKEGESIFQGTSNDLQAFIPISLAQKFLGRSRSWNASIIVKGNSEEDLLKLEDEVRGVMRSIRSLQPREEENFALNKITLITAKLDNIFQTANIAGWIIAIFSILVGGFGVANIMFVTVRERTPIIGIQKALGAQKIFILLQFLGEAVLLCLFGGLLAIAFVALITLLTNAFLDFKVVFSLKNVLTGLGLSSFIGIISGFVPALRASNMDPISAIRFNS